MYPQRATKYSHPLNLEMSDMFVLGKFLISVQVTERNTFVVSLLWKSAKIRELLR